MNSEKSSNSSFEDLSIPNLNEESEKTVEDSDENNILDIIGNGQLIKKVMTHDYI